MSIRDFAFLLAFLPGILPAQSPSHAPAPLNPTMRAVLLANRPQKITEAEWLRMMEQPVNRSLYPLHVTRPMLDTLDLRQLDPRYQYVMEPGQPTDEHEQPR